MIRWCDIEVCPLYDGENITVFFIEGRGDDDAKDLLTLTLCHDEARALADILLSAIKSETNRPTYGLNTISIGRTP